MYSRRFGGGRRCRCDLCYQDTSRLVSVQKLPDNFNDACRGMNPAATRHLANIESREEQTLLSALESDPLSALMANAAQRQRENTFPHARKEEREAAEARAHRARTPVRTIHDTLPRIVPSRWTTTPTKSSCRTIICGSTRYSTVCRRPQRDPTTSPRRNGRYAATRP